MERTHRLIVTEIITLLDVILRKTKIHSTLEQNLSLKFMTFLKSY